MVKESLTVKASVTTLTAKVETLTKNIEQQKQTEKELQVSKTVVECNNFYPVLFMFDPAKRRNRL